MQSSQWGQALFIVHYFYVFAPFDGASWSNELTKACFVMFTISSSFRLLESLAQFCLKGNKLDLNQFIKYLANRKLNDFFLTIAISLRINSNSGLTSMRISFSYANLTYVDFRLFFRHKFRLLEIVKGIFLFYFIQQLLERSFNAAHHNLCIHVFICDTVPSGRCLTDPKVIQM